jgi:hypothetical protein
MGTMPAVDRKQRSKDRAMSMQSEVKMAFERFVDQKWRDSLNIIRRSI